MDGGEGDTEREGGCGGGGGGERMTAWQSKVTMIQVQALDRKKKKKKKKKHSSAIQEQLFLISFVIIFNRLTAV